MNLYTQEQLDFIKTRRPTTIIRQLTAEFNNKFQLNKSYKAIAGVCKRRNWPAAGSGKFCKGMIPHNAGKAGTGYSKSNSGSFGRPGNTNNLNRKKPVGYERHNKERYVEIKIAEPNVWKFKHIVSWNEKYGPIPTGYVIRFIDGDKSNCDPDNLELISKQLNLHLNRIGYQHAQPEIKPVLKMLATVEVEICKYHN